MLNELSVLFPHGAKVPRSFLPITAAGRTRTSCPRTSPHCYSTNSAVSQALSQYNGCSPSKVIISFATFLNFCPNTQSRFSQKVLIDTTPLPDSIPRVDEIGSSSAPLLSASYFIGARCKPFNDDFMVCKTEAHGTGEIDCLKEGRKVTRCAATV